MAIGSEEAGCCVGSSRHDGGIRVTDVSVPEKDLHHCPKCEKAFSHGQILQLHIQVHESNEQKTADCVGEEAAIPSTACMGSQGIHTTINTPHQQQHLGLPPKKAVGLTKIRLEDCLRCDACSCIYIDKSDYNKHMKNFHQKLPTKKQKVKKECRSCCRHCNCKGNHKHHSIEKERGNNNLFHYNIKDRWSKMVSQRINVEEVKRKIKQEPACEPETVDYSHLLSQVEVKIKTEPSDDDYTVNVGVTS